MSWSTMVYHTHMQACTYTYVNTHIHTCTHTYTHIHPSIHMYTQIYMTCACIHIHTCTSIHPYIHIHTYIHTYAVSQTAIPVSQDTGKDSETGIPVSRVERVKGFKVNP